MKNNNWIELEQVHVSSEFNMAIGGNPLVSQTLIRRGINEVEAALSYINPWLYKPSPPIELPGMSDAVDHLIAAIEQKRKICVWGDFDVDGQTATAILVSVLKNLGADVIYQIPDRVTESHGINIKKLKHLISNGIQLLISCDTGINDHESVQYAVHSGIDVIITDHHDLPDALPIADAIINPKILAADHPLSSLPGVGVAYKVAEELSRCFDKHEYISKYLDLVALWIVADLALLTQDTRFLLQCGLEELRNTNRVGLSALMEACEINPENITEEHIAYLIAPRLNALGRLSNARSGVELLLTSDYDYARKLAITLEKLNEERKLITIQVLQAAMSQIERNPSILQEPVLILEHSAWPIGVIGIVASRLAEQYNLPTILFTREPNGLARGSARSIDGIDITAAISSQKDYLESFGGHPMAGGLSIKSELLPKFKQKLFQAMDADTKEKLIIRSLKIDSVITLSDLSQEFVTDIERLAPFGPGNPSLVFVSRNLNLSGYAKVGRSDEHMLLTVEDKSGSTKQAIWWQGAGNPLPEREFNLAYSVRSSTYQGGKNIQIEWLDYQYTTETLIHRKVKPSSIIIDDYRETPSPQKTLESILLIKDVEVWGECVKPPGISVHSRLEIRPATNLVIWTIPPSQKELHTVLEIVHPQNIYLFSIDPGMDDPKIFLTRLAGLLQYALKYKNGRAAIINLAAACGQCTRTVREAIKWLQLHGYFRVNILDDDSIIVAESTNHDNKKIEDNTEILRSLLLESAAYRAFYKRVDKDNLITLSEEGLNLI